MDISQIPFYFSEYVMHFDKYIPAVMAAYGFAKGTAEYATESGCVAALMKMYQKLTENA